MPVFFSPAKPGEHAELAISDIEIGNGVTRQHVFVFWSVLFCFAPGRQFTLGSVCNYLFGVQPTD
jgi:hypothetical protein